MPCGQWCRKEGRPFKHCVPTGLRRPDLTQPSLTASPHLPTSPVILCLQELSGRWVVEPCGMATMLRYDLTLAPKLAVPATLVNHVVRAGLPANILALAQRAEQVWGESGDLGRLLGIRGSGQAMGNQGIWAGYGGRGLLPRCMVRDEGTERRSGQQGGLKAAALRGSLA